MEKDYLKTIWYEYGARDGFCVQLRSHLSWDKAAFDRLTQAMRSCCKEYEISTQEVNRGRERLIPDSGEMSIYVLGYPDPPTRLLPDWLAEIFWFLSHFVRDWTSHEVWDADQAREPDYFQKAYQRLDHLASWFFTGRCPWRDEEKGWSQTFVE